LPSYEGSSFFRGKPKAKLSIQDKAFLGFFVLVSTGSVAVLGYEMLYNSGTGQVGYKAEENNNQYDKEHVRQLMMDCGYDDTSLVETYRAQLREISERDFDLNNKTINYLCCSHDGNTVTYSTVDNTAYIGTVPESDDEKDIFHILKGHTDKIVDICYSHNDLYVVTVSHDCSAMVWEVGSGKSLCTLKVSEHKCICACISRSDKYIFIGDNNGQVSIYDMSPSDDIPVGIISKYFISPRRTKITCLVNSQDGSALFMGTYEGVYVLDLSSGRRVAFINITTGWTTSICLSLDCRSIICGSVDGNGNGYIDIVNNIINFNPHIFFILEDVTVNCLCNLPGLKIASGMSNGVIMIWDVSIPANKNNFDNEARSLAKDNTKKRCIGLLNIECFGKTSITNVYFSKLNNTLVSLSSDGNIKVWGQL
jgi:WD40 repeat protein